MTTTVDIINRALQSFGARVTVSAVELANQSSNEAIQAQLVLNSTRDQLCRMAPWDFCDSTVNLSYITSLPGTPENPTPAVNGWVRGLPHPPWAYEYAYPPDCLRALRVLSWTETGVLNYAPNLPRPVGGTPDLATTAPSTVPIFGSATQYPPTTWSAPPKFKIVTDKFFPAVSATVAQAGTGHAVGDVLTLAYAPLGSPPVGSPVQLLVTGVTAPSGDFNDPGATNDFASDPGGGVTNVEILLGYDFNDTDTGDDFGPDNNTDFPTFQGGGYFVPQTTAQVQGYTTGQGTGAAFNLKFGPRTAQRVIVTNQPQATLRYVARVVDPDVMDDLFIEAWVQILGARICLALTGDKSLANMCVQMANKAIMEARSIDANEGFEVNDIPTDWISVRGYGHGGWGDRDGFDWGPLWPSV